MQLGVLYVYVTVVTRSDEVFWKLYTTGFLLNHKSCSTTVTVASGLFKLVPFYVLLLIFDLIIY